MTPLEILKAARLKLTPEGAWTQGAMARDRNGIPCCYVLPHADIVPVCWCVIGAVEAVEWSCDASFALGFKGPEALAAWNDAPERTHAEVIARFDEKIAKLEQSG